MTLTPREAEVLDLISKGYGDREIAHRLGISPHTVKGHADAALRKLGARNRPDAVRLWLVAR